MIRARLALVLGAAATLVVVAADRRSMVGALIVLCFLGSAPGIALMRALAVHERGLPRALIAVATSFAIDAVVTETTVYAHIWTAERGCYALVALTLALVGVDVARTRRELDRRGPSPTATEEVAS